jgi:hypothetical protein
MELNNRWKSLIERTYTIQRSLKHKQSFLEKKPVVYYAHPKWLYDTPEEKRSLKIIRRHFGNKVGIIDPKKYDCDPEYSRQKKSEAMRFCYRLIDKADCLAFQCFNISSSLKNFILDYLAEAEEHKGSLNWRSKKVSILRNLLRRRKILTPGVAKEVSYALRHSKLVYELQPRGLRRLTQKPNYAVLPLSSYSTFDKLLKAFRSKNSRGLFPQFWWLY